MTTPSSDNARLMRVRKYPNRRLYDATNSRDLTMAELYDHVAAGGEVEVTDSKSGEDITNAVLIQLLLERDMRKLSIFPSAILHQVIRTQHQFLGGVVEQFFRQAIEAQRSTQEQWSQFLQRTLGVAPTGAIDPIAWSRQFFPAVAGGPPAGGGAVPAPADPAAARGAEQAEIEGLRRQLEELRRELRAPAKTRKRGGKKRA